MQTFSRLGTVVIVVRGLDLALVDIRALLDLVQRGVCPLPLQPLLLSELRVGQQSLGTWSSAEAGLPEWQWPSSVLN